MTKNIPIASATPEQIKRFALMVGCDIEATDSPETTLSKLRMVWQSETIAVAEAPDMGGALGGEMRYAPETRQPGESSEFAAVAGAARLDSSDSRSDPRVILTVQSVRVGNDVSKLQNFVPVAVNGYAFQIQTGKKVDVPYRVWEALNNAVRNEVTHDDQGEVVETEVHAYPFNVHEMPSRSEVSAWLESFAAAELVA